MSGTTKSDPQCGDVIIARSARQGDAYTIQIFQHLPQILYPTYELALEKASRWAAANDVGIWLTEDGSTFTPPYSADEHLLRRVKSEFAEMPGLQLTVNQAERLWHIDPRTCERVLERLVERQYLVRHADGRYGRITVA